MGSSISTRAVNIQSENLPPSPSFEPRDIVGGQGCDTIRAVFTDPNLQITSASFHGDVREDSAYEGVYGDLKSFIAKSPNGDTIRVTLEGDSVSVDRYEDRPLGESVPGITEFGIAHHLGICVVMAFQAVDDYIDRNGLRPVVDEVKRRRWAIAMGLAILTAII